MERKESKDQVNIKLTFLDLFPSFEEIDSNNEGITINLQNFSFSYDLSELIKTRDELLIPNQIPNQIIKVTLLKSDNIYATGPLTIKNGEQWVTFNYEHKKKTSTNLALSLIDCIKIKFMCKMDYIISNKDNENENNILNNTEIPNKADNNLLIKPSPKKLYSNLTSNKKKSNYLNKAESLGDPLDSLHTEESKISKIFENMSPELKYNEGNNVLNNTTLPSNKKSHKNPLIKSDNLSEFNPLAASSGVVGKDFKLKDNKNKNIKKSLNNNIINQKRKTNNKLNDNNNKDKENKKQKSNNNISLNNNENDIENKNSEDNKQKSNLKRNRSKNLIDNKIKPNKKEKHIKSNTNNFLQCSNNSNQNQSSKKLNKENSLKNLSSKKEIDRNEENDNIQNNFNNIGLINQISNDVHDYSNQNKNDNKYNKEKNDNCIDDFIDFGLDNFSKRMEDFHLLYSDEYIKNIKQEDYSLEIELYIEKLIELISEYHLQIEEKDIEYQLLKNTYKKNINLFSEQNKLFKKLQLIIDENKIKEDNKKSILNYHGISRINNIITNKNEINIFNYIYFSEKEKEAKDNKEKLKKILKNILNKPKHKNFINQNEKIKKWINLNIDKPETTKEKGKKRITTGKSQKTQQDDKDKGKYNKNKKNINNTNNAQTKAKNKFNKK